MVEQSSQISLFEDPNRQSRPELQTPAPLPMTREEMDARGWDEVDVVFITGDAYVDSPSFANGLLARVIEADGFRVAVLSQPNWNSVDDFRIFGRPRLAFAVSAGNMDSMLNHYTANRKVRNDDAYSPGGVIGRRPDRATLSYCQRAREAFPSVPIITGGVEASLRRIAHYDYWSDRVRRSILLDAKADILIYGMGERQILEILRRLNAGESIRDIRDVRGTVYRLGRNEDLLEESETVEHLPSYDEIFFDANIAKRKIDEKAKLLEAEIADAYKKADALQEELLRLEAEANAARGEIRDLGDEYSRAIRDGVKDLSALKTRDDELRARLAANKEKAEDVRRKINEYKDYASARKSEKREVEKSLGRQEREAKLNFVKMTQIAQRNLNPYCAKTLLQEHGDEAIVVNPPVYPYTESELDFIYGLPYTREAHPSYTEPIPAVEVVRATIQTHRGCFGGCSFCAISAHQGKFIQARSEDAIIGEIERLAEKSGGDYVVSDLNAPTANMYRLGGVNREICKQCRRVSCLCPEICKNLDVNQSAYVKLLKRARELDAVKTVLIASGIRTDLAIFCEEFIEDLAAYHTGGHLKTAPEHVDNEVLRLMNKPPIENYEHFCDLFEAASAKAGKEQYCVPYLISGFPGSTLKAMVEVAVYLKKHNIRPEQVQDFIPAPFQAATCAYYTGIDPETEEEVYVPKTLRERRLQRALLFYYNPDFYYDVKSALKEAGREDLVGDSPDALIPPHMEKSAFHLQSSRTRFHKKQNERAREAKEARRREISAFDSGYNEGFGKRQGREKTGDGGYRGGAKARGGAASGFGGAKSFGDKKKFGDGARDERRERKRFDGGRDERPERKRFDDGRDERRKDDDFRANLRRIAGERNSREDGSDRRERRGGRDESSRSGFGKPFNRSGRTEGSRGDRPFRNGGFSQGKGRGFKGGSDRKGGRGNDRRS